MKIPIDENSLEAQINLENQSKELFDDHVKLEALSDDDFLQYVGEHIHKVVENPRDRLRITNFLNKIDDILERIIPQYQDLVSNTPEALSTHKPQLDSIHGTLNNILVALFRVLINKANIGKFRSTEYLIKLVPICLDFSIIRKSLHILFSKFSNEELKKEEFNSLEPLLPRFCQNVYQLFQHYNLASFYSKSLIEIFQDDPRYSSYIQHHEDGADKDSMRITPEYTNELIFEAYKEKEKENTNNTSSTTEVPEQAIISVKIPDVTAKYPNQSHIMICKKINEEYRLNLKEESGMWDSLAFKIRACMDAASSSHRSHTISVAIDSLKLLVCFRKLFNLHKNLKKYNQYLPPVFDFTTFVMSSFKLFHLQLIPDLHESIITCTSSIMTMMDIEQDEFRDFSQQIVTQYQLFQKILKDCTTLQVEFADGKPQLITQPNLLPPETASSQDFLGCLLYLLHIGINQSFVDSESSLPTNQIYSITGIISSLLSILKPPVNNHFLYSVESINITLDTFWIIIPHQNFINDLNIMDKLIDRTLVDLELLLEPESKPLYHLVDGEWRVIKETEHFEVIQGLLKLLDSPFEHQVNTRGQQAPTIARKMAEGNLVDVFKKAMAAEVINDNIFMAMLLLISDIARELPNAVDGFIDKGVIDVVLFKLQKPFARDFPHIHLVVYFINMLGFNKKGFELERQYKIMEKLFEMFTDWNQAGNILFNEIIGDIAKELQELLKSVENYREPIADLMIANLQKLAQIEDSFFDSCLKKLKGENTGKITYSLKAEDATGKMEEEQGKATESTGMEIVTSKEEEPATKELLMKKEELQEFEKDLKRISMLIQTNCNIYSRILISEFKMRDVMHKKNSFEFLFKVLSFPLLPLADLSPITWASSPFKHMANKLAGTDHDVQDRIYECLMQELKAVEELVGTLAEGKDFSKVLSDEICYDARNHGLYYIINKYKDESIDMIYLMGKLSYSELLIDFLRYHDPIKVNQEELFKLIDRLSDLYVLIINQIKREDMHYVKNNLEAIKTGREELGEEKVKEIVEKCRITIMESHSSNRFTYHQTLRKFFKKILAQEYEHQCGDKYANIALKITEQLYVDELKLGDEETTDITLAAVNTNNSVLAYLHEFFFSTNYRKFRNMPQFFFTFFQGNGYHRIIETLNQLRVFTENYSHHFQEETSIASLEKIKLVLLKESLSQNYHKLSLIMKMILLLPIELRMDAKINGTLEPHAEVKLEYFYGANKDIIDKFFNVFTGFGKTFECFYLYHIRRKIARQKKRTDKTKPLTAEEQKDNKEGVDTFYENLGTLIETSFECLRKIQELYKGPPEEGLDDRGNREQAEALIQTLVSMGFPRDRAELAARNAEYLDVEPALVWLENYDATQGTRQEGGEAQEGQPMEEEQTLTKQKEGDMTEESEQKKIAEARKENIENAAPRVLKRVTKEKFQKEVVLQSLQDLSKHIIANIFFFEGYDGRVLEIIQISLETQEGDAKKLMTQEIAVMIFKLLKHNINNFTKGVKFISKFKVSKSFEKSITFTKESLHKMGTQKVSLLHKIRAINNILPWFNHFLSFIPNIEKNLLKSDFVTELLRFFEQMLKDVDEAKESGDDQEMLHEIANTLTGKFFHTLFVILKLRNSLDDSKRDLKKDTKTPKKDTQSQLKETTQIQVEKETTTLKDLKPSQPTTTKPSTDKEQGAGGQQDPPKKGLMELMISILNQAEQFSLKQKRSIIFFQSSLCVYMKVLNLLLQNNQENCKTFVEKKGLQELIKYKLDTREPKGTEFLREFGEICSTLMSEPALDLVSLECSIKNFFYHLSSDKVNLRVFTEHFKEQLTKDPEGFMGLVKELCQIEEKEPRKESLHKSKSMMSLSGNEPKSAGAGAGAGNEGGEPQLTRAQQGEERKESPNRQNTLTRRKRTEDSTRSKMISLKPDIEYSRLYSLNYLAQIGEDVKVHQESHHRKKRKRSNKPEDQKDEDISTHILDFVPPTNSMHVIHTLMDNLVQLFNSEINGEAERPANAQSGEVQFHALFSYSFILVTFQIILQKHPILSQNILRQNVTRTCKNTLKNPTVIRNLDLNRNISFLSYFLRVIVFSTMDIFKNFLLSICSNTSLIVDKDRSGNPYVTPYFFDLKKKILSEIYQILDEGVNLKPFYKTKDDCRLFCAISSLFFYLLPLKDIARIVYDNSQQFNFLKMYSEALKQLKVGNYEHLEKLNVFISEPLGILIQYHHYFALSKEGTELKTIPGDLFMPKKSLTANSHFVDDWKKMINPALKGDDYAHGGSRYLRLPVEEEDEEDEIDEILDMEDMEGADLINEEDMDSDEDGDNEDLDDQGDDDNDLEGIRGEDGEIQVMQIEREGLEDDDGYSGEGGEDEWTDIEEDYSDDEDDMDNEDDEDDDEDDHDEDDMYGDNVEDEEIIIQSVDDDDDEEGNTDEEDDGDDEDDMDDISEESFIDFDASDEEDEGGRDLLNLEGFLNGNNNASRRNQHGDFPFGGGSSSNNPLTSLINVPHSNHPEIQRVANLIQANSARFDAEGAVNIEANAPAVSTTQIQIVGRQNNQALEIVQQQEQLPGGGFGVESTQVNNEPRSVFDRIHDEIAYLQSHQYLQDNRRSAEFNENFFENVRQTNPVAEEGEEGGVRVIRNIRNIFDGAAGGRNNFLSIFNQVLAPLENGRRDRNMRPIGLFEGSEFIPFFGNNGGATFRIHTTSNLGLQLRGDGQRGHQNAHHGHGHGHGHGAAGHNRPQNDNEAMEDFESQLLEQLAPAAPRAAQREEGQAPSNTNEEPNPFEELRSRPEDEQAEPAPENNRPRGRQGRRRRQEQDRIEEEEEVKQQEAPSKPEPQEETKTPQDSATKKPEPATTQTAAATAPESSINFEAFGLAPDFLEKNGIDPVFFNELDDELKYEIMAQYMNKPPTREAPVARRTPASEPATRPQPTPQNQNQNPMSTDFMNALSAAMNLTLPNTSADNTNREPTNRPAATGASDTNNIQNLVNSLSSNLANMLGGGAPANTSQSTANNQPSSQPQNTQPATETEPLAAANPATTENNNAQAPNSTYNENMNEALDNAAFIASLAPDLREEILATAEPAFLASLPQEMVMEAEAIRARHGMMRMNPLAARGDTFMLDDDQNGGGAEALGLSIQELTNRMHRQQNPHREHVRKVRNFFKEALLKDKTLGSKLYTPDEKTLEAILKLMYMSEESFERFPYNVMKSLMLHPQTEYKVLDCLLFLLKNSDLGEKLEDDTFPCKVIYEKNSIEKNYRVVYEKISLKILFLLEQLTRNEPLAYFVAAPGLQEEGVDKKRDKKKTLQSLNNIKGGNKEGGNSPLLELIRLLSRPGISNSATHMKLLLNILNNITRHLKTTTSKPKENEDPTAMKTEEPKELIKSQGEVEASKFKLDRELVSRLCACLTNSALEEDSLYKLSNIICIFCTDKHNFVSFIAEFKLFINKFSEDANKMLADKMRILKKVISDPTNEGANDMTIVQDKELLASNFNKRSTLEKEQLLMNLLNRLDAETDYEIQLNKILKLVKELFEKSLIEFGKRELSQEQKDITTNKDSDAIDSQAREKVKDQFRELFEDGQLQALWINITEFLSNLNEIFATNWAILSPISHKLQPVLESFFIIYKILNDDEAYEIYRKGKVVRLRESRKPVNFGISRLVSDGEVRDHPGLLEDSFQRLRQSKLESNEMLHLMCEKNKNILNMMVKQNPHLLSDNLSIVVKKMPKVLDFENKRSYFKNELKKIKRGYYNSVRLQVSRANLFIESFNQIMQKKPHEMRGKLNIEFYDEEGVDAGGVTREWFLALSKEILNPNYALFKPAAHGSAFQPSPQSNINPDHLKFFKFVGRIIGKALHDGYMLDCYFTRSFYKHILGQPLTYHDIEDIDPEYYRNLTWILENDVTGLDLPFSYEAEEFGVIIIRDLIPDGRNIVVTEDNKRDYVQRICYAKMANDIKEQIEAFLQGFHEVIPPHLIQIFDNKELELMISGLPDIDIPDLKDNTEYHNYTRETEVIGWFWEILEDLDRTHKAAFLQFVTGTSKVPIGGFKDLVGMGGALQKFQIHKSFDINKLPTSHTCFNQLDLPEYKTKEALKEKLMLAITEGKEGFGFV